MNVSLIENITKMPLIKQNQNIRIFSKLDLDSKLKTMEEQRNIFFKLRNIHENISKEVLTLSSLILAIEKTLSSKDEISKNILKVKRVNKERKKEKLLTLWAIIKRLKNEEKMSFRDISKYLRKFHKLEVSYSLIYNLWNQLEIEDY